MSAFDIQENGEREKKNKSLSVLLPLISTSVVHFQTVYLSSDAFAIDSIRLFSECETGVRFAAENGRENHVLM